MKKIKLNILTLYILLISGYCTAQSTNIDISVATNSSYSHTEENNFTRAISDNRISNIAENISSRKVTNHNDIEIKNEAIINTDKLDFSPFYYKDQLVFVSTRGHRKSKKEKIDEEINDNYMSLWKSNIDDDGTLDSPELFSKKITSIFHEGPVCFNESGDRIFFTSNDFLKGNRRNNSRGVMKLQIYTAVKIKGEWSKPSSLDINSREYEEAHPAISPDGQRLYFSSDREGGFGGMDLYASQFVNGKWSEPMNLGEQVNTAGNDVFPYVHHDGTLYFASDGWQGLGGLDIYEVKMNSNDGIAEIENIGSPFNSPKDDFSLVMNDQKTEGFFTSARDGGLGRDDIYSFKTTKPAVKEITIYAYEAGTKKRLDGVEVIIQNLDKKNVDELELSANQLEVMQHTNKDGELFSAPISANKQYNIVAKKEGYQVSSKTIKTGEDLLMSKDEYVIVMEPLSNIEKTGIDKSIDVVSNTISTAPKNSSIEKLATNEKLAIQNASADKVGGIVEANKLDELGKIAVVREAAPTSPISKSEANSTTSKNLDANKFAKGDLIEMPQIYYDFNQFKIRDDAKFNLDKVVAFMRRYPSLSLELGSHTDARGSSKYNKSLSQNRADEAVRYIIMQGIDGSRLIARGYGESQLRNKCANYIYCSEEDHQFNRRTEIRVLKIDESNTKVKYEKNMPTIIDKADPNRKWGWD